MIADHITCQMLVELATDWMEGALAAETTVEMELHMVTCANCVAYVEQLRKTRDALSRLDDGPPPPEVRRNLLNLFRRRGTGNASAAPGDPGDPATGGPAAGDGVLGRSDDGQ